MRPPLVVLRQHVKDQSEPTIEEQRARSKRQSKLAECEASRPACCPQCLTPSRPLHGGLQVRGHGERRRTQLGPEALGEAPTARSVGTRRYRCKKCGATIEVAPRGVLRRRLYSCTAIGLALALFGLEHHSADAVREAVAPTASHRGLAEGATWSTLRRWAREAKAGTLLEGGHACPATFSLRQAAERMATTFQALGPRGAGPLERVWQGALDALWRGAS